MIVARAKCGLGNHVGKITAQRFARKIFGQGAPLRATALGRLSFHIAFFEGLQNLPGGELGQKVTAGSTGIGVVPGFMTDRTIAFEERGAVLGGGGQRR